MCEVVKRVEIALAALSLAAMATIVGCEEREAEPQSRPATTRATTGPVTTARAVRRVHVFVSGRVQAVGFRNFTEVEAHRLGVTGWVRNLADGRVEAIIEGPADKVAQMLELLKKGPSSARVDKLEATDEPSTGEFSGFSRRT